MWHFPKSSNSINKELTRRGVNSALVAKAAVLRAIDRFDSVLYCSPQFDFILTRHEQGAGHMAEGYARATGKCGVALVTSGPGATNTVTPLMDAQMDGTPIVVFAGQVRCTSLYFCILFFQRSTPSRVARMLLSSLCFC